MAALCREFDVSRKTGYKIFQRDKDCGLEGLTDRSRRLPAGQPATVSDRDADRSAQAGAPELGAPKIREKLRRLHSEIPTPAISAVHAVLVRHGLVNRGRKRRPRASIAIAQPSRNNRTRALGFPSCENARRGEPIDQKVF